LSPYTEELVHKESGYDVQQCKTVDGTGSRFASNAVNGRHSLHGPHEGRAEVSGVRLIGWVDAHQSHCCVLEYQVFVIHRRVKHRKVRISKTNLRKNTVHVEICGVSILKAFLTHTHPFNGSLSRTTRVSQYQKGKTNLDFTEA